MTFNKIQSSPGTHKVIALFSLIILSYLQFSLIYTTYKLKDKQYILKESRIIENSYKEVVRNDKLYPGGEKIVDSIIYRNMQALEDNYYHDPTAFALLKQKVCDSIVRNLRINSNMDSVFKSILKKDSLDQDLKYLLVMNDLAITFNGINYVSLYKPEKEKLSYLDPEIQNQYGIAIDGELKNPTNQNHTAGLMVSSPTPRSYYMGFAIHVDYDNRKMIILKSMTFSLLLSISFIILVISIYYFTFRNWLRQKKLADMKTDFLNSITHEFNTPIATILVANSSIRNKEIIGEPSKIYPLTEVIQRQTQRLQTLINQALDISQMNKNEIEKEVYDMASLLEEIINDYKLKISENVSIIYNFEHIHALVLLNRFLLTTMLYNIFDNALKYNTKEHKEIKIEMITHGQSLTLCIRDNGVGMNKKLMKSIFDKFYRGKNGIKTRGLGLGLFYVKQTVEAHNWELNLTSEPGQCSTFCITMPVEKEKF
ncbi:HAMP domain-containing sensor histidine kinase [Pedobacter gandavensis]|uniref:sensor histidine kinase n=1 Tax=Pedobacter gandavensis TaxID=2679963 RepID=UPI00292FA940|nr:HAMP domain-containing sensor histidine kinase [Pedobacter gandavensis]